MPAHVYGSITLDGSLNDWSTSYSLPIDWPVFPSPLASSSYYAKVDGNAFLVALETTQLGGMHLLLNTDLDPSTGATVYGYVNESLVKGLPGNRYVLGTGIDYQVSFAADGTPELLTGDGVLVGTLPMRF